MPYPRNADEFVIMWFGQCFDALTAVEQIPAPTAAKAAFVAARCVANNEASNMLTFLAAYTAVDALAADAAPNKADAIKVALKAAYESDLACGDWV